MQPTCAKEVIEELKLDLLVGLFVEEGLQDWKDNRPRFAYPLSLFVTSLAACTFTTTLRDGMLNGGAGTGVDTVGVPAVQVPDGPTI